MPVIELPIWETKEINKTDRNFLWNGSKDLTQKMSTSFMVTSMQNKETMGLESTKSIRLQSCPAEQMVVETLFLKYMVLVVSGHI